MPNRHPIALMQMSHVLSTANFMFKKIWQVIAHFVCAVLQGRFVVCPYVVLFCFVCAEARYSEFCFLDCGPGPE
jgi:hypothetical protein